MAPEHDDCGDVAEEAEPADQRDADTLEEELDPGHELGVPARRGAVLGSRQVHVRGPTVAWCRCPRRSQPPGLGLAQVVSVITNLMR